MKTARNFQVNPANSLFFKYTQNISWAGDLHCDVTRLLGSMKTPAPTPASYRALNKHWLNTHPWPGPIGPTRGHDQNRPVRRGPGSKFGLRGKDREELAEDQNGPACPFGVGWRSGGLVISVTRA